MAEVALILALDWSALALLVTAVFTGLAGLMTGWASIIAARRKIRDEMNDQIETLRRANENLSQQVYELRMRHLEQQFPELYRQIQTITTNGGEETGKGIEYDAS